MFITNNYASFHSWWKENLVEFLDILENIMSIVVDRCAGISITLDYLFRICVPNETEYLNLCVFNMITEISESRTFTKLVSCNY